MTSRPAKSEGAPADVDLDELAAELTKKLSHEDDPHAHYEPHLHAVRSKTHGYAYRVPGSISNRLDDLLSRHEYHVYLFFDWRADQYRNIRTQFGLPPTLAQAVAELNGHTYPWFQGKPAILSVDFVLSLRAGGWEAVDFKPKEHRKDPKVAEKLAIAEETLKVCGVPHEVLTEEDIPATVVRNYRFLRILRLPFDEPPLALEQIEQIEDELLERLQPGKLTIFEAALDVAGRYALTPAKVARASYWLVANRRWPVDFHQPIGPDYPLVFKPKGK